MWEVDGQCVVLTDLNEVLLASQNPTRYARLVNNTFAPSLPRVCVYNMTCYVLHNELEPSCANSCPSHREIEGWGLTL